jgi:proteasome lid subunit RPN8/RPN11
MSEMQDMDRERAMILHLDTKNNVVGIENISTGTLNATLTHPREAVKGAILNNAAHVIFIHNHPSGDPIPSKEDMAFDRSLKEAFAIVAIDLLDSLIIGNGRYYSAKEQGSQTFNKSESRTGERIMERDNTYDDIDIDTETGQRPGQDENDDDVCSLAMDAAMAVISEKCGSTSDTEPHQGRFLRLHIKQELKTLNALVADSDPAAKDRAKTIIQAIDSNTELDLISAEYGERLKTAVGRTLKKQPYYKVMEGL